MKHWPLYLLLLAVPLCASLPEVPITWTTMEKNYKQSVVERTDMATGETKLFHVIAEAGTSLLVPLEHEGTWGFRVQIEDFCGRFSPWNVQKTTVFDSEAPPAPGWEE